MSTRWTYQPVSLVWPVPVLPSESLKPSSRFLSTVYCILDPDLPPVLIEMCAVAPR